MVLITRLVTLSFTRYIISFPSLKVRTFKFCLLSEVIKNPETLKSLHIMSAYSFKEFVPLSYLLHSRKTRYKVSYLHSSVEKFIVFGEILEASKAIGVA